jgi:hypothetical protein
MSPSAIGAGETRARTPRKTTKSIHFGKDLFSVPPIDQLAVILFRIVPTCIAANETASEPICPGHENPKIKQPDVWTFEFMLISHLGIPI